MKNINVMIWLSTVLPFVASHPGHHEHPHPHSMNRHDEENNHHHHPDSMGPHTHVAYHHVEAECASDVERLCTPVELPSVLSMGDPFLDWIMLPMMAPPPQPILQELDDLTSFLDAMLDSATQVTTWIIFEDEPEQMESLSVEKEDVMEAVATTETSTTETSASTAPEQVMDSLILKLAEHQGAEDIPRLAQQLIDHGHRVMEQELEDSIRHRLARRLTEIDPHSMHHGVHMPFGCTKNRCLQEAWEQNLVSRPCADAMTQLEHINHLEVQLEHRQAVFFGMMWMYVLLLTILLVLMARKYRKARVQRRLKARILQAIYSNPKLKAELERELGESVGNVPPLANHVLSLFGAGSEIRKEQVKCARRVQFVFFAFLFAMVFVAPFWVVPMCILVSIVRVAILCCAPTPIRACSCCCCGVSTDDVQCGNISEQQACCNCCMGTGVCKVGCAQCCGNGGNNQASAEDCDCCCCCGCPTGSCCCSKTSKMLTKAAFSSCCCCCGATPQAAAEGTLTKAQLSCCCCGGTGISGAGDCDCCCCNNNKRSVGRGQKHVLHAKEGVFEGIPIQMV